MPYTAIPGLVGAEDDWWTIDAGYVVSKHMHARGRLRPLRRAC